MSTIQCTILNDAPAIKFAREELLKYTEQVSEYSPYVFILGEEQDFLQKNLIKQAIFQTDEAIDAFQLLKKGKELHVIGSNPRSVLFGVYHALKKLFGYKWVSFLSRESKKCLGNLFETTPVLSGKMKRRGLVVENYEDTEFLLQLIDWAAKHYINELFFTFMLWDKVKGFLGKEIEKRGLSITIGGHSMHYLAGELSGSQKDQIDFSDYSWKSLIINKIKQYCDETSSIKRISLWPADVGIKDQHFLAHYISFTEQIKKQLPDIQVEHIAYNAGLSWEMLELPNQGKSSESIHTLFAYWGRNYHKSFSKEDRALMALEKWSCSTKENHKELTIFEYYSDHFMLGGLFPPLFQRIREDMEFYSQMGIDQIVNLIVPYVPKSIDQEKESLYPWQSIQLLNSYFFARLSWGEGFNDIEDDFYSMFKQKHSEVKQALCKIEELLSEVSKWNVPLFPNRLIDPEKVEFSDEVHLIINDIRKWKKDIEALKGKAVSNIDDPDSMISFYIYYVCEKLEEYLCKWKEKESFEGRTI